MRDSAHTNTNDLNKNSISSQDRPRRNWARAVALTGILGFLFLLALAMRQPDYWNYEASPGYTLRIIDDAKQPLAGVRVVHAWGLDINNNGGDEAKTDSNGWVALKPVNVDIAVSTRVKMLHLLHIHVQPSVRGLGWENYTTSRLSIFLPEGYAVDVDNGDWREYKAPPHSNSFTNAAGFFIRGPFPRLRANGPDFLKPRGKLQYDFQEPHTDLFFPHGFHEFELHVRKGG